MAESLQPIEIFYSYAHEDVKQRDELNKHLFNLRRQGIITAWYDQDISAGTNWKEAINQHLNSAHIILLLISSDFMASDYCYSIEMKRALERHEAGEARVIPVLLKTVDWEDAPFSKLQPLPKNARAVSRWHDKNEAFAEIAKGIREAAKEIRKAAKEISPELPVPLPVVPTSEAVTDSTIDSSILAAIEEEQNQLTPLEPIWDIPYKRNPFFTGREKLLEDLHKIFIEDSSKSRPTLQALSGLGGMGKTQSAVEYAYRHREHYQFILWAKADSQEVLTSEFVRFANLLNLPGKHEQDKKYAVTTVKRWLERNTNYLLILDNVENIEMVSEFLPSAPGGHLLLTTQRQMLGGLVPRLQVEKMSAEEAALLLLHRANLIPLSHSLNEVSDTQRQEAITIAEMLDGLPLAIDQAAAYIDEMSISLPRFIDLYKTKRTDLFKTRRGSTLDHPESVTTTFSLSFDQVEQANGAAAELLRFFAFLHPDAIPEELILKASSYVSLLLQPVLADPDALSAIIGELRKYSLVRPDPEDTSFSIHRMVQAVLKDTMNGETQRQWAEHTIQAVNAVFPKAEFETWQSCQRYLPHAQVCLGLIQQWNIVSPEVGRLLNEAGHFLDEQGQYPEAALFLEQALTIRVQKHETQPLAVAESLNNLGELYRHQGKYTESIPFLEQALAIREQVLGRVHPEVASSLNDLARPYHHLYQYNKAESLYQQALTVREQLLNPLHPDTAETLNDLGLLYKDQGNYVQAKPLLERALANREQTLGPLHPDTALSLNNLAELYKDQGNYVQAKPLLERALANREQTLGPLHPDTAQSLNNLAMFYKDQGNYVQAKPLMERALAIYEQTLGPLHPDTAHSLNNIATLLGKQGNYVQAKPLMERALAIYEQTLGPLHPDTAQILGNLATHYTNQRNFKRAEPLYQRALAICEQVLGLGHPRTVKVMTNYIQLLIVSNRRARAAELQARLESFQQENSQ